MIPIIRVSVIQVGEKHLEPAIHPKDPPELHSALARIAVKNVGTLPPSSISAPASKRQMRLHKCDVARDLSVWPFILCMQLLVD